MTNISYKRHSIPRYWGVRLLSTLISLACLYIAVDKWDLSSLLFASFALLMGAYGFLGRDSLNGMEHCPR